MVDAALGGNLATTTVLDKKLDGYDNSFFPSQAGENDILYIPDPRQPGSGAQIPLVEVVEQVAGMSDDERRNLFGEGVDVDNLISIARNQRQAAEDWTRADLRMRFDMIETPGQKRSGGGGGGPTDYDKKRMEELMRKQDLLQNWRQVGTGNKQQQKDALNNVVGLLPDVLAGNLTEDGKSVVLELKDGNTQTIDIKDADGNVLNEQQWLAAGTTVHGIPIQEFPQLLTYNPSASIASTGRATGRVGIDEPTIDDLLGEEVTLGGNKGAVRNQIESIQTVGATGGLNDAVKAADNFREILNGLGMANSTLLAISEDKLQTAGVNSPTFADYPGVGVYIPEYMDVPMIVAPYSEAYNEFFGFLADAAATGTKVSKTQIDNASVSGAYNSDTIRNNIEELPKSSGSSSGVTTANLTDD